jgi:glycosyltransferase involved in cell wall biosynthesis
VPAEPSARLPITAIVASRNEASLLHDCLEGVSFCDEVIVIDIDSSDGTAAVAEAHGATVVPHPYVPIAEQAREQVIREARHDWLLIRDPDEVIPQPLAADVVELFERLEPDVGLVTAPIQRYFGSRPIKGGTWGGVKRDRLLAKRGAVEFPTAVHRKLVRMPGCREVVIPFRGDNVMAHHWVTGYRSFVEKHRRYLRLEGPDRADAGEVTGVRTVLVTPWRSFGDSYVREEGYRDGLRGVALSGLWAAYRTASEFMLLRELRRRRRR